MNLQFLKNSAVGRLFQKSIDLNKMAQIMHNDLLTITTTWSLPRKIIQLTRNLMNLAA